MFEERGEMAGWRREEGVLRRNERVWRRRREEGGQMCLRSKEKGEIALWCFDGAMKCVVPRRR